MIHTRITLEALADRALFAWNAALVEQAGGDALQAALVPEIQEAILQVEAVTGMTWAEWLIERQIALGVYTRQEAV